MTTEKILAALDKPRKLYSILMVDRCHDASKMVVVNGTR